MQALMLTFTIICVHKAQVYDSISFTAAITNTAPTASTSLVWHFDFGDGNTTDSPGPQAGHVFTEPGQYTVTVTLETGDKDPPQGTTTILITDQVLIPSATYSESSHEFEVVATSSSQTGFGRPHMIVFLDQNKYPSGRMRFKKAREQYVLHLLLLQPPSSVRVVSSLQGEAEAPLDN